MRNGAREQHSRVTHAQNDAIGRAFEWLSQALTYSRAAGDRFAEKLTLDQIGSLHAALRDVDRAIATARLLLDHGDSLVVCLDVVGELLPRLGRATQNP